MREVSMRLRTMAYGVVAGLLLGLSGCVPAPSFTATPTTGEAPLFVEFKDTSTVFGVDGLFAQEWDFGNGESTTEADPRTLYLEPGTYTVSLRVASPVASAKVTRENLIVVTAPAGEGEPEGAVEGEGTPEGQPEGVVEGEGEGTSEGAPEGVVEGEGEGTTEGEPLPVQLTRGLPAGFIPGCSFTVQARIDYDIALDSLGLNERFPAGWTVTSVSGPDTPFFAFSEGAWGFFWITVPSSPVEFSYTVQTTANTRSDVLIDGEVSYSPPLQDPVTVPFPQMISPTCTSGCPACP